MNLTFLVRNKRITRKGLEALVGDTAGHYTFTVDFDQEWEGLVKVVVFQNGADTAQMIYTGQSALPPQVSGRGDLYVACHGYRRAGDTVAVVRTIRMTRPVRLLGSSPMAGGSVQQYTPTVFEQVLGAAQAAENAAKEAAGLAAELRAQREQGEFNGPAGPAGQAATVTVEDVREGEQAAVVNLGTERNARLHFTLPRGRGIAAVEDNWDGTWTVTYTDGSSQVLTAPGTATEPGQEILARAVAAYLTEYPPEPGPEGPAGADGRGIETVSYSAETGLWTVTYTDGAAQTVAGPEIPSLLSQLAGDAEHRTVTDAEKSAWNGKSEFSGAYGDLSGVPSSFTPGAHDQAAETITEGTFAGAVKAGSQDPETMLLRNCKAVSAEEDPAAEGEIVWVYA